MSSLLQTSYVVWQNELINRGLLDGDITITASKPIIVINMTSAQLVVSVSSTLPQCNGDIYLNGSHLGMHQFITDLQWSETFDVLSKIVSGNNVFSYKVTKTPTQGWGEIMVTVNLIIDGEVVVGPTLPTWWPYAAAGGGIILLAVLFKRLKGQPIMVFGKGRGES